MKTESEIKVKLIEIESKLLNEDEAIRSFKSCFGREMNESEGQAFYIRIHSLEIQKELLEWMLE